MKKTLKLNENALKKIVAESVKKVLKEGTDFSDPNWSKDYDVEACYEDIAGFLQQGNYLENLGKDYDTDTIYQALMKIAKEYEYNI